MKKIIVAATIGLALTGCSQKPIQPDNKALVNTGDEYKVVKDITGAIQTGNENKAQEQKPMLVGQSTASAKKTLIEFYDNINNKIFDKSINILADNVKKQKSVSDYFNPIRLGKFVNALDGGVTIKNIVQTPKDLIHDPSRDYRATYGYDLAYGMGGTLYVEHWTMNIKFISQENRFNIVSLTCQKNCSNYPFFNLDKFGIK